MRPLKGGVMKIKTCEKCGEPMRKLMRATETEDLFDCKCVHQEIVKRGLYFDDPENAPVNSVLGIKEHEQEKCRFAKIVGTPAQQTPTYRRTSIGGKP